MRKKRDVIANWAQESERLIRQRDEQIKWLAERLRRIEEAGT